MIYSRQLQNQHPFSKQDSKNEKKKINMTLSFIQADFNKYSE